MLKGATLVLGLGEWNFLDKAISSLDDKIRVLDGNKYFDKLRFINTPMDFSLLDDLLKYYSTKSQYLHIHRGCPMKCSYCVIGYSPLAVKKPEVIIKEIPNVIDLFGVKTIALGACQESLILLNKK